MSKQYWTDNPKTLLVVFDDEKQYSFNAVGFPSPDIALVVVYSKQGNVTFLNTAGISSEAMANTLEETAREFRRKFEL